MLFIQLNTYLIKDSICVPALCKDWIKCIKRTIQKCQWLLSCMKGVQNNDMWYTAILVGTQETHSINAQIVASKVNMSKQCVQGIIMCRNVCSHFFKHFKRILKEKRKSLE